MGAHNDAVGLAVPGGARGGDAGPGTGVPSAAGAAFRIPRHSDRALRLRDARWSVAVRLDAARRRRHARRGRPVGGPAAYPPLGRDRPVQRGQHVRGQPRGVVSLHRRRGVGDAVRRLRVQLRRPRRLRLGPGLPGPLGERVAGVRAALPLDLQLAARVPRHGHVPAQPGPLGTHHAAGELTVAGSVRDVTMRWREKLLLEGGAPGRPATLVDGDGAAATSPVDLLLSAAGTGSTPDVVGFMERRRVALRSLQAGVRRRSRTQARAARPGSSSRLRRRRSALRRCWRTGRSGAWEWGSRGGPAGRDAWRPRPPGETTTARSGCGSRRARSSYCSLASARARASTAASAWRSPAGRRIAAPAISWCSSALSPRRVAPPEGTPNWGSRAACESPAGGVGDDSRPGGSEDHGGEAAKKRAPASRGRPAAFRKETLRRSLLRSRSAPPRAGSSARPARGAPRAAPRSTPHSGRRGTSSCRRTTLFGARGSPPGRRSGECGKTTRLGPAGTGWRWTPSSLPNAFSPCARAPLVG